MKTTTLNTLFILIFFISCATPYQKLRKNGGYSDEKINDHVYRVTFQGNERTSDEKVYKYFLKRCSELTLENKFSYFIIIESEDLEKISTNISEGSIQNKKKITTMAYSGDTTSAYSPVAPTEYKMVKKHIYVGKIALFKEGEEPIGAFKAENVLKDMGHEK